MSQKLQIAAGNNDNAHQNEIHAKTRIILNSHSPDMSYAAGIRKGYWGRIKQIPYQIKKRDIVIWESDIDGEIRRNHENDDKLLGNGSLLRKTSDVTDQNSLTAAITITSS